ncbi:hypothetical protein [Hydrogenophaga sp.]|uniref:hypothetical protein n=1 Tax=Hydrogenophaga sp. TaxID=1904254 RepID=UPI00271FC73C|nr:hypothetical protein [Hydrogenophaga sp.]MDO9434919.1 hypothetical protein [Hydrogenophaga sp.]
MSPRLPLLPLAYAALAWAVCLAGIAWLASALLDRALGWGEWLLLGALLAVAVVVFAQSRMQRRRREIDDMRDSALW